MPIYVRTNMRSQWVKQGEKDREKENYCRQKLSLQALGGKDGRSSAKGGGRKQVAVMPDKIKFNLLFSLFEKNTMLL